MRNNIVPILSRYKRKLYVEPFGGACGLLFGKEREIEVYNDANQSLVNLFRVLRNPKQAQEIERLCNITPVSRVYFNELRELVYEFQNGRSTITLQNELGLKCAPKTAIAFAFFYVMNTTFRGNVANLSYGGGEKNRKGNSIQNAYYRRVDQIPQFCERLRTVAIENLDYRDCLMKYDCDTTLFYLDPPYEREISKTYKQQFNAEELVELLLSLKGSFVLSCYNAPVYERLLEVCERATFKANSTIKRNGSKADSDRIETCYYSKRGLDSANSGVFKLS